MRTDYIYSIILFFPLLIIQTTIVPLVAIDGAVPDLILIMLVFYTIRNGQVYGTVLGFIYGFIFDLITGSFLGSTMLSKTLAGFLAGYFYNENRLESNFKSLVFSLIVLLCASVDSVIYTFITQIDSSSSLFSLLIEQGMIPGIYTALLSFVVVIFYPQRSIN
ncbi:MAG: rod shape-determining protein MreD [Ignavibacteria bacterium CG2_30_36_16]|nr:rod shape-determining protein MreD [Ignavibacteria bacterium]OIP63744.1 MAG: rod shape-determining protein MreD [Ignavibacteria bacterium CG2_30_36_16]PJB01160.1 MAG: rod shape-determining protein MreD [Ignavibacteria bacterium CG_4_9_14_3_um_filter_36_18]